MKTRDEATLSARARMTPEERDEAILRDAFGPLFDSLFGAVKAPDEIMRPPALVEVDVRDCIYGFSAEAVMSDGSRIRTPFAIYATERMAIDAARDAALSAEESK